jgi:hypothetical protein
MIKQTMFFIVHTLYNRISVKRMRQHSFVVGFYRVVPIVHITN